MPESTLSRSNRFDFVRRHEFILLLAIIIVVCVTGLLDSQTNYWRNPADSIRDIARQTALLGIFSLGAAIVIITGGIDLSSGSVICFSGTICATLLLLLAPERMQSPDTPLGLGVISVAIGGTMLVGFLIGTLHAWLITIVGLPPFVATLATLVGLRSFARAICENVTEAVIGGRSTQINLFDDSFRYLATSVWIPVLIFLVLSALAWLILSRTVVGRHLYALGGNEEAARLSGIRTDGLKWLAYCISAMLASIAGILYIADQSVAEPQTLGRGYELNAIAAAVVGGCSLQGGIGTIPGTVLGALFLRVVIDGVAKIIKTGADVYEGLIVGVVVVIAVAFSQFETGTRSKRFFTGALGIVTVVILAILAGSLSALMGPKLLEGKTTLDATSLGGFATVTTLAFLALVRSGLPVKLKRWLGVGLLLLAVATAVGLDYQLPHWRVSRAVAAAQNVGGTVQESSDGLLVDLSGQNISDDMLAELMRSLRHLPNVVELRLNGTQVTDEGLKAVEVLVDLTRLNVADTSVTQTATRRLSRSMPDLDVTR